MDQSKRKALIVALDEHDIETGKVRTELVALAAKSAASNDDFLSVAWPVLEEGAENTFSHSAPKLATASLSDVAAPPPSSEWLSTTGCFPCSGRHGEQG